MKKIGLRGLLLALVVVEIYLCSAFLPTTWQTAIIQWLSELSPKTPDYSVVTHPALSYEIDDLLRTNMRLGVALYAVILLLLAGNTFFLVKVWDFLRLTPRQGIRDPTRVTRRPSQHH